MIAMVGGKVGLENPDLWSHGLALAITDLISVGSHVGRTLSLKGRKKGKEIGSSTLAMDGQSGRELVATLP
jgi:hypothetical protein